jgi:superfamily II DNA or RNA helicase
MSEFTLRPYQHECVNAVITKLQTCQRVLAVCPTGSGKTIIFAKITDYCVSKGYRVLILAHREELLSQARDKMRLSQGIESDLERAESQASLDAQVVVASVQSISRPNRLARFPHDHFNLIIIDEAHRTLGKTYRDVLDWFGKAKTLGVTATADRGDNKNLGKVYDEIAYEVGLKDMIDQGYLCPISAKTFPVEIDISSVSSRGGDYSDDQVGHVLEPLLPAIAETFAKEWLGADRNRCLIFAPLRSISRDLVELLKTHSIRAEHIDGETPPDERKRILSDFGAGKIEVLSNAMLLTEGYDEPIVDTILCLRPTQVRALFAQIVGRGTRVHPDKDGLLIYDPLWLTESHSLIKPAHLVTECDEDAEAAAEAMETLEDDQLPGVGNGEVDLFELVQTARETRLEKLERELKAKADRKAKRFNPVEFSVKVMGDPTMADYAPSFAWEEQPPTEKQIEMLEKNGFLKDEIIDRGHANKLLEHIFHRMNMGLATTKQVFWLHKMGVADANSMTVAEASATLDQLFNRNKR